MAKRIISTYVENTIICVLVHSSIQDHLHIRGEYFIVGYPQAIAIGSSPHTWRILSRPNLFKLILQDHLHIRGEYMSKWINFKINEGSSPHTWRILINICTQFGNLRIISTYVENTHDRPYTLDRVWDHLHIRGEYQLLLHYLLDRQGSSPHTWRILLITTLPAGSVGIISTYVENTQQLPL